MQPIMDDYRVGYLLTNMNMPPYSNNRSIPSSEVRTVPRPAKTPAWSHGLLPSPLEDTGTSGSDNASDHSDKIESFCQSQQQLGKSSNSGGRKRKIISNGCPTFLNSGAPSHDTNRGQHDHIQQQKDTHNNEQPRNSIGQGLWTDTELAADFDGSLSGLGADLSTSSYDMSEALLALPNIYHQQRAAAAAAANSNNNVQQNSNNSMISGFLKGEAGLTPLAAAHLHGGSSVSLPDTFHFDNQQQQQNSCHQNNTGPSGHPQTHEMHLDCERRFQYVLAAATSVATKTNEETLTYLNQCQAYEIKLKKLGELTNYRGVVFKTVIRLCFHDRRLQFAEREQLAIWEDAHPNHRMLQCDVPLSYGITMLHGPNEGPSNQLSFAWEPLKEVGIYIKINCISTEFTPKKHGGEKGVPFRLMIETYAHPDGARLHASACQIKVFKLKGADRKHKQDREKVIKKTPAEQSKLQPSYECTVLSDISLESLDSSPPVITTQGHQAVLSPSYSIDHPAADSPENNSPGVPPVSSNTGNGSTFSAHFSPESVRRWLLRNRFAATKTLWDFSGVDLLRLGKEELIEICGLPEGIRLYNALHYKITYFVLLSNPSKSLDSRKDSASSPNGAVNNTDDSIYHPICLSAPSMSEMTSVVGSLFYTQFPSDTLPVERLLLSVLAPGGSSRIRVLLTEQLLSTLRDQTAFKAFKMGSEVYLEIVEG